MRWREADYVAPFNAAIELRTPAERRAWYSVVPGMLGTNDCLRMVRSGIAAGIAVLLSFASLVPLGVNAFGRASAVCCRTHGKCCCNKVKSNPQPGFNGQSACQVCGQMALSSTTTNGLIQPSGIELSPSAAVAARVVPIQSPPHIRLSDEVHRQRPPPAQAA